MPIPRTKKIVDPSFFCVLAALRENSYPCFQRRRQRAALQKNSSISPLAVALHAGYLPIPLSLLGKVDSARKHDTLFPAVKTREILDSPDQKRRLNERIFTTIAPRYDGANRVLSFDLDRRWKRRLVEALPAWPAPALADLACGTGDLTSLLAARYPDGQVLGIDLTEAMLEIARRRCVAPNVKFARGDMSRTGLPAESVDGVAGGYALRNAADLREVLGEIRRILKPGGLAAFLDFSKPSNPFFRQIELSLLTFWTGFWGLLLFWNPRTYTYIAESLRSFPDRRQFAALLETFGLRTVRVRYFFWGVVEMRIVEKSS